MYHMIAAIPEPTQSTAPPPGPPQTTATPPGLKPLIPQPFNQTVELQPTHLPRPQPVAQPPGPLNYSTPSTTASSYQDLNP